jgi:ABC-2 type transport system permease protein
VSLLTVALKDLRLVLRDRPALAFLTAVPLLVITIIASALAGTDSGSLLLPVVNEDQGPVAEVLLESLRKHLDVEEVERAEAERLVARSKMAAAALVLPGGLSKRYLGDKASTVTLLTDPARGIEVETVKALLLLAERDAQQLADPFAIELLDLEERSLTSERTSIPPFEQHVPGFSLMFVLMGVLFGVAFGLRDESEWGTLTRLRVAPVPRGAVLGGKLLARFTLGFVQLLLLFVFGHLVFGVSLGRSLPVLLLLLAVIVFCLTGFSLLVSAFARSREQIIPLGLAVVMLVCSLGGCWWPLYQEPDWLRQFAWATPTAWAMDGIHDLILRDRGLGDVLPGAGVLVAYGAACLLLGLRLQRLSD